MVGWLRELDLAREAGRAKQTTVVQTCTGCYVYRCDRKKSKSAHCAPETCQQTNEIFALLPEKFSLFSFSPMLSSLFPRPKKHVQEGKK